MYLIQIIFGRLLITGVPVDFEPLFFSEVNPTMSADLDQVAGSISKNGICLKVQLKLVYSSLYFSIV